MQQTNEQNNLILAVVLSVLIIGAWQYFFEVPRQKAAEQAYQTQLAEQTESSDTITPTAQPVKKKMPRQEALATSKRLNISNSHIKGSISTKGLRLDDLTLSNYRKTIKKGSGNVELLNPPSTELPYFIEFGWLPGNNNIAVPNKDTVWWNQGASQLSPDSPVTFTMVNQAGITFERRISIDKNYMFTVVDRAINRTDSDVVLTPYALINRKREDATSFFISHEGGLGSIDDVLVEVGYDDLHDEDESYKYKDSEGWLGLSDKYWLTAIIPEKGSNFEARFAGKENDNYWRYQADIVHSPRVVSAGTSTEVTYKVFAGAKEVNLLERYQEEFNIPLFDRAVDFGWLYFLTKPIFHALEFFFQYFGNFGLAILALTVIIKLIMFPIANKGYRSMSKLKELNPKMLELRERFGDDKQALQQELLQLYKRERINPVSGCFPILIQIPIFFALYKTLFVTIEMRHAPFYGWIQDLSAPDPTSIFNLFGLLPYDVPSFLMIGAWPCIMAISMVLMQKMNPPPPDPVQRQMLAMLPYVFVFLFASFPAGLVIYWAWSNTLSILQQYVISRSLKKDGKKA